MYRRALTWTVPFILCAGGAITQSIAQEARLPTDAEVKAMQAKYQAEREELLKKGINKRFAPELMKRAEQLAENADRALLDGRLFQASEGYRQARWTLPFQPRQVPAEHVAMVLGSLRLRHEGEVTAIAFSPDGRLLASGSKDRTVKIWDLDNGHELLTYTGHADSVSAIAFSPDGKTLASGAAEPDIRLWDPLTGKDLKKIPGSGTYIVSLAYTPDGKYLLSGQAGKTAGPNNLVCLHEADTAKLYRTIGDFRNKPHCLSFSPDGSILAVASSKAVERDGQFTSEGEVRVFAYANLIKADAAPFAYWSKQEEGFGNNDKFKAAISPDNTLLVLCGVDGVKLFKLQQPNDKFVITEPIKTLRPPHRARCVIFGKDGKSLALGCKDGTVRMYDIGTFAPTGIYKGHSGEVNDLCYNAAGTMLASAGADHTIRLWQNDVVMQSRDFAGHTGSVWKSSFSPDGRRLVSASADHTARIWDVVSGKVLHTLTGHTAPVTSAVFSPDGKFVASAGGDRVVKIWDADSGKHLHDLAGHGNTITCLDFCSDGKRLASGSVDRKVKIWDYQGAKELLTIDNDTIPAAASFSPDGKQLATGNVDTTIKLYEAQTGKLQASWSAHGIAVTGLAYSPDGNLLASSGADQLARIWTVAMPGTTPIILAGHTGPVSTVAFRKDNQHLATCGSDMLVKLWKLEGGVAKEVQTFRGHKDWITSVNFSKDGFYIVSSGVDRLIKISEITTRAVPVVAEQTGNIFALAVSPDGKLIACGGTEAVIRIWDRASGREQGALFGHTDTITALTFSADSKQLVSASLDKTLKAWDVATAKELPRQQAQQQNWTNMVNVPLVSVSSDGMKLFIWDSGREKLPRICAYNLASGFELFSFTDNGRDVRAVSFTANGKTVVLAAKDGTLRLFDLDKKGQSFPGGDWFLYDKEGQVSDVALSPDGVFLAAGSAKGELKICKVAGKEVLHAIPAHAGAISCCLVSPDGKRIATAGQDNIVKLWDLASGKELRRWSMQVPGENNARRGLVMNLAFTPDGRQLVTANADTTLLVLELP